jgi:hypothetical protein
MLSVAAVLRLGPLKCAALGVNHGRLCGVVVARSTVKGVDQSSPGQESASRPASSCAGTSPASTQPGAAPTVCCIESTSSSAKSWSSASNTEEMFTDPDERSCRPPRTKTITGTAVRALEWSITTAIPGADGVSDGLTCVPSHRRRDPPADRPTYPQPIGTTNRGGCLWAFPAEMQRCPKTGVNGLPRTSQVSSLCDVTRNNRISGGPLND